MANPFSLKGIRLCEDDIGFLRALGTFDTIDTVGAGDWYPDHKPNSVQKRLRLLASNGLIHSARLLVGFEPSGNKGRGGRIPAIHALTPAGADVVEATTGERPKRVLNSRPAAGTFLHRRDVSRVMQTFTRSCELAGLPLPDWILEQDPWPRASKNLPPNQRRMLYHDIEVPGRRVICQPDAAARLKLPKTEVALFFEIDRSTEGHKQLRESTRNDAYVELFNRRLYRRYWPDLETRHHYLFWVCPSNERINNIKTTLAKHPIAPALRFALQKPFEDGRNVITEFVWQTIKGERRQIFRPSEVAESAPPRS